MGKDDIKPIPFKTKVRQERRQQVMANRAAVCGGCKRPFLFRNTAPGSRLVISYFDSQAEHAIVASSNEDLIAHLLQSAQDFFTGNGNDAAANQIAEARKQHDHLQQTVKALTGTSGTLQVAVGTPEDGDATPDA